MQYLRHKPVKDAVAVLYKYWKNNLLTGNFSPEFPPLQNKPHKIV